MSDKDNITLPREVVEKAIKAFENGCPPTCENGMIDSGGFSPWGEPILEPCPACLAFEHLRTHLAAPEPESKTPAWWMDGLTATLMREGVNKHRAREIAQGYWEAYCQIPEIEEDKT